MLSLHIIAVELCDILGNMPLSTIYNGEVLDWHFKKGGQDFIYNFYIGDILIGQIFHIKKSWDAVSWYPNNVCPVNGFRTRYDAAEFLLRLWRNQLE